MVARMHTRIIPSTGAPLPVIGLGTWRGFDVGNQPAELPQRGEVLAALFAAGGSVVDSSPMYGSSEQVAGELLERSGSRAKTFVATKVWTSGRQAGIEQMERSMALLRTPHIDLMQVHNLLDWRTHLATLREWKSQGRISYLGVTHYTDAAHAELEAVMSAEVLDFVQFNYSITDRAAEQRLLPLAAERGIAVLVNLPFGGGRLLGRLRQQALPGWAADIGCESWNQLLLKFVLSQPAVTCVIPGTSSPRHMRDNAGAGTGELPGPAFWRPRLAELGV
ncbi:aldo/keto reductase [Ramlibacter sp. RBP-2]|uniref:Aldo/keto reductase n=1 Tax=Ramlibacter lithotrophicus TaxID=2606681 RepID=A0A7X6I4B4_9BURK|nr:aldo/keto reductase [Ramlibacter lithotrophicus]NKE64223.1 aldo/keto reductase [Ramlibacter lithotrophicus]